MREAEYQELFWQLYRCKNETEVSALIKRRPEVFAPQNWSPLGGSYSNYGTVENQAADPVPALVEKLTNSIDAVLMRRSYEEGIDPKSPNAPKSIAEAVERFFPHHKQWDMVAARSQQARSIQVLADGYAKNTANASIIIYDDGEGQFPEDFPKTFLSLGRGNKNEIKFVQGVYNMGGCGAITFCGEKRFQMVASKRYDGKGKFGYTLIRKHPLDEDEESRYKKSWYEYLVIDDQIPSFSSGELDLGLYKRKFNTGSLVKLYSYDLEGNRNLNRDLSRSINEYLFDPVLPMSILDSKDRFPDAGEQFHSQVLFGLQGRLERSEYVDKPFSEQIDDRDFGLVKVNVFVFKVRAKGKDWKQTRNTFRHEYFKNNMSVLFTLNGQVHGHYTSEFISRSLKFSLLKDYVLIHVDCTNMKPIFRDELTMPSRDRFKNSKQMKRLRKKLTDTLRNSELRDIFKARKDLIGYDEDDSEELLKQIAEDLPLDRGMRDLIRQTMELEKPGDKPKPRPPRPPQPETPIQLQRYPTFLKVASKRKGGAPKLAIPLGGSRTLKLESDVHDDYFDRAEDPGELELAILTYTPNESNGGDQPGTANSVSDFLSVNKKSPKNGNIRVVLEPTKDVCVGDEIELQADFHGSTNPNAVPPVVFWVSIVDREKRPQPKPPNVEENLGLPKPVLVYSQPTDGEDRLTWEALHKMTIEMNHGVVMHPVVDEEDKLETIYINMDSGVLKNFMSQKRNPNEEQRQLANRQYVSRVYYHTLFLYVISKNRNFSIGRLNGGEEIDDVDLSDYLKDLFQNQYAAFLLSFETKKILDQLA